VRGGGEAGGGGVGDGGEDVGDVHFYPSFFCGLVCWVGLGFGSVVRAGVGCSSTFGLLDGRWGSLGE
jgi:hypothetical protein